MELAGLNEQLTEQKHKYVDFLFEKKSKYDKIQYDFTVLNEVLEFNAQVDLDEEQIIELLFPCVFDFNKQLSNNKPTWSNQKNIIIGSIQEQIMKQQEYIHNLEQKRQSDRIIQVFTGKKSNQKKSKVKNGPLIDEVEQLQLEDAKIYEFKSKVLQLINKQREINQQKFQFLYNQVNEKLTLYNNINQQQDILNAIKNSKLSQQNIGKEEEEKDKDSEKSDQESENSEKIQDWLIQQKNGKNIKKNRNNSQSQKLTRKSTVKNYEIQEFQNKKKQNQSEENRNKIQQIPSKTSKMDQLFQRKNTINLENQEKIDRKFFRNNTINNQQIEKKQINKKNTFLLGVQLIENCSESDDSQQQDQLQPNSLHHKKNSKIIYSKPNLRTNFNHEINISDQNVEILNSERDNIQQNNLTSLNVVPPVDFNVIQQTCLQPSNDETKEFTHLISPSNQGQGQNDTSNQQHKDKSKLKENNIVNEQPTPIPHEIQQTLEHYNFNKNYNEQRQITPKEPLHKYLLKKQFHSKNEISYKKYSVSQQQQYQSEQKEHQAEIQLQQQNKQQKEIYINKLLQHNFYYAKKSQQSQERVSTCNTQISATQSLQDQIKTFYKQSENKYKQIPYCARNISLLSRNQIRTQNTTQQSFRYDSQTQTTPRQDEYLMIHLNDKKEESLVSTQDLIKKLYDQQIKKNNFDNYEIMFIRSIIKILNKIKTYKEVDCNSVKGFNEEFLFIYFLLLDKLMNKVQNFQEQCVNENIQQIIFYTLKKILNQYEIGNNQQLIHFKSQNLENMQNIGFEYGPLLAQRNFDIIHARYSLKTEFNTNINRNLIQSQNSFKREYNTIINRDFVQSRKYHINQVLLFILNSQINFSQKDDSSMVSRSISMQRSQMGSIQRQHRSQTTKTKTENNKPYQTFY